MTYKELAESIAKLTSEQQNTEVVVSVPIGNGHRESAKEVYLEERGGLVIMAYEPL